MNSSGEYITWVNNFGSQNLCPVPNGTQVIENVFADESGNFRIAGSGSDITCAGGPYQYGADCRYINQSTQNG